jgi:hypothetical protein
MNNIDFSSPEEQNKIRRPFVIKVEEDVARSFISAVKANGWFVRETIVKLMREFARIYGKDGVCDDKRTDS